MKYLFFIATLLVLLSCEEENSNERTLPPITDTGENTFGCKVNGEVWVTSQFNGQGIEIFKIFSEISSNGEPKKYKLYIAAADFDQSAGGIMSFKWDFFFTDNNLDSVVAIHNTSVETSSEEENVIVFKGDGLDVFSNLEFQLIDENNAILSGEFEYSFTGDDNKQYIIEDGRFDVAFQKFN